MNKKKKFKILAAGDFHGDNSAAKRLSKKAEKEKVDLIILTGDIIGTMNTKNLLKPFIENNQKVIFVPGNWETSEEAEFLSKLYNIKNIEKHYVKYKNIGIFGAGSADWQLNLDEEKTFNKLKKEYKKIKDLERKILVSHLHAANTAAEFSGFPGSTALRKAIKEFQPDLFISGHIHEAEGLKEKIGKTLLINTGKKGTIIEL